MEKQLINTCHFTPEIFSEYYISYVFKRIKIVTFLCMTFLVGNLISLIKLNKMGYKNLPAIIIVTVLFVIAALLHLFLPNIVAVYNYTKKEMLGKEYLINKFVFFKDHFEISCSDINTIEYYDKIKEIRVLDNITILVMQNKKINYILENKGFENGNLDELEKIIKGES